MTMPDWPRDRPILLLSAYRSGSTALCSSISEITGCKNFDEIWHRSFRKRYQGWKECNNSGLPWVGKVMSNQVHDGNREQVMTAIHRSFVVSLRRRDVWAQIVSWYLCLVMHKWHYQRNTAEEPKATGYEAPLQKPRMINARKTILDTNRGLEQQWLEHVEHHLWYEDLVITNGAFQHYLRPSNYNDVMQLLREIESDDPQIPPQQ